MLCFSETEKAILKNRLNGKYEITKSGCWVWNRSFTKGGYGLYRAFNKHTTAHRIMYAVNVGGVDDNMHIDHICKNKGCVNPSHLEMVKPIENMRRASKAQQTHCINGREFTERNTYRKKFNNTRVCRLCAAKRQIDRRRRKHT